MHRRRSLLLAVAIGLTAGPWPGPPQALAAPVPGHPMTNDARFATRLYHALAPQAGNLFFSPASVRVALAMATAGARGQTASQLHDALALPAGKAADDEIAALLTRWRELDDPPLGPSPSSPEMQRYLEEERARRRITLAAANRLWAQAGGHLRDAYVALLRDRYGAPLAQLDFKHAAEAARIAINKWVSDQTHAKIKELLAPRTIGSATRVVLTNAIYFKAAWQKPFDVGSTQPAPFHVAPGKDARVPFMHDIQHRRLGRIAGGRILELGYGAGDLALDVVLPDAPGGLPRLERALADGALPTWLASLAEARVEIVLPRWKSASSFELGDAMRALGAPLAFTFPGADFSGIDGTHDLFISAVIHKAVIAVDEAGTEAAAATAVLALAGGPPPSDTPTLFRADHPFLYFIRDTKTGAILFLGRLVDPS